MDQVSPRTSPGKRLGKNTRWRKVQRQASRRQDCNDKTGGRSSFSFVRMSDASHTCILIEIYAKSGRKGRQCVLRAIYLALSTPKYPDPR